MTLVEEQFASSYRICADPRSVLRRLPLFGLASLSDVLAIRRELEGPLRVSGPSRVRVPTTYWTLVPGEPPSKVPREDRTPGRCRSPIRRSNSR